MSRRDEFVQHARGTPFDNSSNGFSSTDVQSAIEEVVAGAASTVKAGYKANTDFTGSPKKATITFITPFPSTNYAVTVTGVDGRFWVIENKTANGFVINASAAAALTGDTFWIARMYGE